MKLAGDHGDAPPPALRGVAAVSPVIELEACVRALERRSNVDLPVEFRPRVAGADVAQERSASPDAFRWSDCRHPDRPRVRRGIHRAAFRLCQRRGLLPSRQRHAGREPDSRPGSGHSAADDPFVPAELVSRRRAGVAIRTFEWCVTPHGGHCGFLEHASGNGDGYWAGYLGRRRRTDRGVRAHRAVLPLHRRLRQDVKLP